MSTVKKTSGGGGGGGGPFTFIRNRASKRLQHSEQSNGGDGTNTLTRWLRDLRPASKSTPAPDRSHPAYHSEGKGLRRRKYRDKRRHSFNETQPQPSPNSVPVHGCSMARDVAAAPTTSPSRVVMMSARSKPQPPPPAPAPSIYSYLHSQSGLNFAPVVQQQTTSSGEGSPPPAPPVRDASSLKNIKYGPGHEKFPSWPSDTPRPAAPGGGSHRSKSWTDHTNYPKEKGITYTRPYMKRPNPAFTQQLKTVMEKCEKIPPETFESRPDGEQGSRMYLPRVDREGKALGDNDYMVPSPPERDVMSSKPQLTQADLEEYARSYQDPPQLTQVELEEYARSYQEPKPQSAHLTQADLEEYARTYEESLRPQHQQQQSYAQSEGYHSYVSSTDSITTTPFLDRLRRDSEATARPITITQSSSWDESSATERPGRDSVVTTSSGSASSSETLKWHGSLSDVSVASSSCLAPSSSRQLIAHSARVPTPQRHHSESVLYLGNSNWVQRNNHHNQLRLFPVNTYTVQPSEQPQPQPQQPQSSHRMTPMSPPPPTLSVAERISELERQQTRYTYLDPEKRHRVSDPTLKAIQKKALLSFYERHHSANNTRNQTWRSEPQLAQPTTVAPQSPPPQPPPRPRGNQSGRRASSASDYAGGNWREATANRENGNIEPGSIQDSPRHQHSSSCGSLSADLLGPLIIGPSISVDDWVPERPPKKPHLRAAFPPPVPDRLPSPDLPPPSPPPVLEDEVFVSDEPLPPPPPELHSPDWNEPEATQKQHSPRSSSAHPQSSKQQERSPEESETQNDSSRPQRSFVGASLQEHCESSNSLQVPIALNATRHISNNNTNSSMSSSNNNNNNNHSQRPHDANTQEKHNNVNQNGISSQRSMDRAFSLSRSIEDCSSQKSSQRQQNSVTQRYREGTTALKPISNGTSKAESSYQQYRSSSARHFENGQKQTDCSSLPRSNGSASSLLQKYQDSNNRISQLNYVPAYKNMNETFSRTSSIRQPDTSMTRLSGSRSSLRYPTTQKLMVNGKLFSEQSPHLERGTQRTSSILLPPKTHFQRFTEASTEDKSSSQQNLAQQDPPPTFPRLSIHNPQSTSKASYLHRDRGLPNFEGSYKRTMSPSGQEQEPPAAVPTTVAAECDNRIPSATSQPNNEQQAVSSVVVLTSVMTDNKENVRTSNSEENIKNESESGDTVIRCKTTWSSSPVSPPDTTKETETQTQCNRQSPPPPSPPARSPPASPSPPLVTESLQLVQRSEVVLRVNAATSDAASQTESERELEQEQQTPPSPTVPPPLPVRQKLQEEIDCERLSLDLASHLSPSDKLQGILVPAPEHKKLTDYVSGLFRLDTAPRPRTTSATSLRTSSTITSTTAANQTTTTTLITTVNHVPASSTDSTSQVEEARESSDTAPLSANSAYFTTSESKAKFLTQYGRDMTQSEQLNGICDNKELQKKKEELMARLTRKLQVLRGEHLVVTEESRVNDELGENVAAQVNRLARPHEASKYRLHVEEVGKITSLLLGLSGRLARAENALMGLPNHHAERKILESKRDKLREQLEEAKKLKENIDRRSVCVSNILYKYFNAEEYADYDHFINMKAKLIMDSREIADKIKLGEEQLAALKETLTAPD